MLHIHVVLVMVMAGLSSGCTSTDQVGNVHLLDLMNDSQVAPQPAHEGRGPQGYRHPTINWSAYNKVLLQPVAIREGLWSELRDQERHDLLVLTRSFDDKLHLKLSKDYEMVRSPRPGTMLIQVAITHLEESSAMPALWSNLAQELQAVVTIYTLAGKPPFSEEVTAEFMIRDAQTGALLAAGIDRCIPWQNRFNRDVPYSWSYLKNSLEFWAELSAYRLCVLRGASDCVEPQVHSVIRVQRMG